MRQTLLCGAFIVLLAAPGRAADFSVESRVEPRATPPGLPVRVELTLFNRSSEAIELPRKFVVEVRNARDETFLATGLPEFLVASVPPEYEDDHIVAPHSVRVFDIPLGETITDGRIADPRLWRPGEYRLRLFFHDDLDPHDIEEFGLHGLLGAHQIQGPLLETPEMTFSVEAPTGIDAEVWSEILERSQGRGLYLVGPQRAEEIARTLLPRVDGSAYMPYLHSFVPGLSPRERDAWWARVVAYNRTHPVAEAIRLGAAVRRAHDAEADISRGEDLASILMRTDSARAELNALIAETSHDLIRTKAQNALRDQVKSNARLKEMYREIGPKH